MVGIIGHKTALTLAGLIHIIIIVGGQPGAPTLYIGWQLSSANLARIGGAALAKEAADSSMYWLSLDGYLLALPSIDNWSSYANYLLLDNRFMPLPFYRR